MTSIVATHLEQQNGSDGDATPEVTYTLVGTGSNRAILILATCRNDRDLTGPTLNGVAADALVEVLTYSPGGSTLSIWACVWLDANVPGAGSFDFAGSWSAAPSRQHFPCFELQDFALQDATALANMFATPTTVADLAAQQAINVSVPGGVGELGLALVFMADASSINGGNVVTVDANSNLGALTTWPNNDNLYTGFGTVTALTTDPEDIGFDVTPPSTIDAVVVIAGFVPASAGPTVNLGLRFRPKDSTNSLAPYPDATGITYSVYDEDPDDVSTATRLWQGTIDVVSGEVAIDDDSVGALGNTVYGSNRDAVVGIKSAPTALTVIDLDASPTQYSD